MADDLEDGEEGELRPTPQYASVRAVVPPRGPDAAPSWGDHRGAHTQSGAQSYSRAAGVPERDAPFRASMLGAPRAQGVPSFGGAPGLARQTSAPPMLTSTHSGAPRRSGWQPPPKHMQSSQVGHQTLPHPMAPSHAVAPQGVGRGREEPPGARPPRGPASFAPQTHDAAPGGGPLARGPPTHMQSHGHSPAQPYARGLEPAIQHASHAADGTAGGATGPHAVPNRWRGTDRVPVSDPGMSSGDARGADRDSRDWRGAWSSRDARDADPRGGRTVSGAAEPALRAVSASGPDGSAVRLPDTRAMPPSASTLHPGMPASRDVRDIPGLRDVRDVRGSRDIVDARDLRGVRDVRDVRQVPASAEHPRWTAPGGPALAGDEQRGSDGRVRVGPSLSAEASQDVRRFDARSGRPGVASSADPGPLPHRDTSGLDRYLASTTPGRQSHDSADVRRAPWGAHGQKGDVRAPPIPDRYRAATDFNARTLNSPWMQRERLDVPATARSEGPGFAAVPIDVRARFPGGGPPGVRSPHKGMIDVRDLRDVRSLRRTEQIMPPTTVSAYFLAESSSLTGPVRRNFMMRDTPMLAPERPRVGMTSQRFSAGAPPPPVAGSASVTSESDSDESEPLRATRGIRLEAALDDEGEGRGEVVDGDTDGSSRSGDDSASVTWASDAGSFTTAATRRRRRRQRVGGDQAALPVRAPLVCTVAEGVTAPVEWQQRMSALLASAAQVQLDDPDIMHVLRGATMVPAPDGSAPGTAATWQLPTPLPVSITKDSVVRAVEAVEARIGALTDALAVLETGAKDLRAIANTRRSEYSRMQLRQEAAAAEAQRRHAMELKAAEDAEKVRMAKAASGQDRVNALTAAARVVGASTRTIPIQLLRIRSWADDALLPETASASLLQARACLDVCQQQLPSLQQLPPALCSAAAHCIAASLRWSHLPAYVTSVWTAPAASSPISTQSAPWQSAYAARVRLLRLAAQLNAHLSGDVTAPPALTLSFVQPTPADSEAPEALPPALHVHFSRTVPLSLVSADGFLLHVAEDWPPLACIRLATPNTHAISYVTLFTEACAVDAWVELCGLTSRLPTVRRKRGMPTALALHELLSFGVKTCRGSSFTDRGQTDGVHAVMVMHAGDFVDACEAAGSASSSVLLTNRQRATEALAAIASLPSDTNIPPDIEAPVMRAKAAYRSRSLKSSILAEYGLAESHLRATSSAQQLQLNEAVFNRMRPSFVRSLAAKCCPELARERAQASAFVLAQREWTARLAAAERSRRARIDAVRVKTGLVSAHASPGAAAPAAPSLLVGSPGALEPARSPMPVDAPRTGRRAAAIAAAAAITATSITAPPAGTVAAVMAAKTASVKGAQPTDVHVDPDMDLPSDDEGGRASGSSAFVRSELELHQRLLDLTERERRYEAKMLNTAQLPRLLTPTERAAQSLAFVSHPRLTTDGQPARCHGLPAGWPCHARMGDEKWLGGCNCALAVDHEFAAVNPWSDAEKLVFMDKFMQFPKDFQRIAAFLPNKTPEDCVRFYYDTKHVAGYKQRLKAAANAHKKRVHRGAWTQACGAARDIGVMIPADVVRGVSNAGRIISAVSRVSDLAYSRLVRHPGPYARVHCLHRFVAVPLPISGVAGADAAQQGSKAAAAVPSKSMKPSVPELADIRPALKNEYVYAYGYGYSSVPWGTRLGAVIGADKNADPLCVLPPPTALLAGAGAGIAGALVRVYMAGDAMTRSDSKNILRLGGSSRRDTSASFREVVQRMASLGLSTVGDVSSLVPWLGHTPVDVLGSLARYVAPFPAPPLVFLEAILHASSDATQAMGGLHDLLADSNITPDTAAWRALCNAWLSDAVRLQNRSANVAEETRTQEVPAPAAPSGAASRAATADLIAALHRQRLHDTSDGPSDFSAQLSQLLQALQETAAMKVQRDGGKAARTVKPGVRGKSASTGDVLDVVDRLSGLAIPAGAVMDPSQPIAIVRYFDPSASPWPYTGFGDIEGMYDAASVFDARPYGSQMLPQLPTPEDALVAYGYDQVDTVGTTRVSARSASQDAAPLASEPAISTIAQLAEPAEGAIPDVKAALFVHDGAANTAAESDDAAVPTAAASRWTDVEKIAFIKGLRAVGRDWKRIHDEFLASRTSEQIRAFYQNNRSKLHRVGAAVASAAPAAPPDALPQDLGATLSGAAGDTTGMPGSSAVKRRRSDSAIGDAPDAATVELPRSAADGDGAVADTHADKRPRMQNDTSDTTNDQGMQQPASITAPEVPVTTQPDAATVTTTDHAHADDVSDGAQTPSSSVPESLAKALQVFAADRGASFAVALAPYTPAAPANVNPYSADLTHAPAPEPDE